ncbi:hypothetical protein GW17_00054872, partial [Ensete ventricosum]
EGKKWWRGGIGEEKVVRWSADGFRGGESTITASERARRRGETRGFARGVFDSDNCPGPAF